jgi:hypothetical protein
MRAIIFALAVTVASAASGQVPGGYWVAGPFQPSAYGGFYYSNPSVPRYTGPIASPYWYDDDYMTAREVRRLRWAVEDARISRRRR